MDAKHLNLDALDLALHSDSGLPTITRLDRLDPLVLEKPPELIKGVLHAGCKMIIGGGSKSNKTWVLMQLAHALASGGRWLEFETSSCRVLYVNMELLDAFFWERMQSIDESVRHSIENYPQDGLRNIDYWGLRGYRVDVSKLREAIQERVQPNEYGAIILDPLYKIMAGRNENAAGEIADFLNIIDDIARYTGAAVLCAHHFSKGNQAGKEQMDRFSGSGVFARDPDALLTMTKHKEEDCFTVDFVLRNHPHVESFVLRWVYPISCRVGLDPADLKAKAGASRKFSAVQLFELLPVEGCKTKDWLKLAREETGMSERTFHTLLKQVSADGSVTKDPVTRIWTTAASQCKS